VMRHFQYPQVHQIVAILCESYTNGSNCMSDVRKEILTGEDLTTVISVNPPNSILNRLSKLLAHLISIFPSEGWDQYYTNSTLQWQNIVVCGHSQGAGHSAFIGTLYSVFRVIQYGGSSDAYSNGAPGEWTSWPKATSQESFFGLSSEYEFVCTPEQQNWIQEGMPQFGALVDIESASSPYFNSRQLCTSYKPAVPKTSPIGLGLIAHVMYIADDSYLPSQSHWEPIWTYFATLSTCSNACVAGSFCASNGTCISVSAAYTEAVNPCICHDGPVTNTPSVATSLICSWILILVAIVLA